MGRVGGDEDDFELAPVEVVADYDLVAVPRESRTRFGDKKVRVRFELYIGDPENSVSAAVVPRYPIGRG